MTSILYRNGIIHSPADPFAEALLVDDGVVTWIGANDTADGLASRAARVIDLDGALVAPGFVDAHVHLLEEAFTREGVDLSSAPSRAAALDALAARARAHRADDGPLLAHGWDETTWADSRRFTAAELDAACAGAPVYAARVDLHCAVVSTRLAELAGLAGRPGWHDDGFVAGEAHVAARQLARQVDATRHARMTDAVLRAAAARGVVAVHENSAPGVDTREGLTSLLAATADAASGLPLVVGYRGELCRTVEEARSLAEAIPGLTGIGGDLSVDGSIGARSAALREPYADAPGTAGDLHLSAADVEAHVLAVTAAGLQAGFHVIGDRACDTVVAGLLAAGERERSAMRRLRHRLEHVLMIDDAALAALATLGVGLSMQPAFDAAWGGSGGLYDVRLGTARAGQMNRFAAIAAAGVPTAFGSDAPVTALSPWAGVRAAVYHHTPEHRISARAAFRAATRGGWRLAGLDHTGAGEIRLGSPAHLAVWTSEHVGVQSEAAGLSSWSTDARSGTPLLPDLSPDAALPQCRQTVRAGQVIFDTFD
ncbi:hypothetical protein SAMN05216410_1322 [Sanguibacter gelidistatuariae]|uniref:Amidohydrolase 3 domain-containing protein n=1 Tax=Sanguibacter gelidistatuariae TaxID=1814289 RepID=A0A1G6JH37_9MICO|nr:amidohydrolase family protein [Sanguibacter gelidistatuariae]SDC17246.1 hypothetical protein SAMN05216410_1322 [Sanguibacter gelidistatuariae]